MMAENSNISWTDHTFSPWLGCTKVSPACDHCYAEAWAKRSGLVRWGNEPRRRTSEGYWKNPLKWNRAADKFEVEHGRPQRVFCASLSDVFDNQADPAWRDDLWDLIGKSDRLVWMLLTKRPQNIKKMLPAFWDEIKGRVWLGTTVEDQPEAGKRISHLLQHDAALRFLSCEPLLSAVDLTDVCDGHSFFNALTGKRWHDTDGGYHGKWPQAIDWVICGGESGPKFRAPESEWIHRLHAQCAEVEVPFFFKQHGGLRPTSNGHLLDGEVVQELPPQAFKVDVPVRLVARGSTVGTAGAMDAANR